MFQVQNSNKIHLYLKIVKLIYYTRYNSSLMWDIQCLKRDLLKGYIYKYEN